jgi:branched-chain amino acid transport system substrate-binding protein
MLFHAETCWWRLTLVSASLAVCSACDALLELDRYALRDDTLDAQVEPLACTSDLTCQSAAELSVCSVEHQHCVPVLDARCEELAGDITDPNALRLGALLTLHGPELSTNRERRRALQLAVEQLSEASRPFALVTCDTGADVVSAGRHLIEDLGVVAILGPNSSDDTLDLTTRLSTEKRTLTLSPTAMASSLRNLADDDLSWLMVPTDVQRAPLMQAQIHAVESKLRAERKGPVKLSIIYRDDVFGHGLRLSLSSLTINNKTLSDPNNVRDAVQIAKYDPNLRDLPGVIASQLSFEPDIIVLAAAAEGVTDFMAPLEEQLRAGSSHRPHYVLTDATKVGELTQLVQRLPDLAERVRGVGLATGDAPAWGGFERALRARFTDAQPQLSGVATAYDAVHALALAAGNSERVTGPDLAAGLRALDARPATYVPDVQRGAAAQFRWDERGAPRAGSLAVWCLRGDQTDGMGYATTGELYDVGAELSEEQVASAQRCHPKGAAESPPVADAPTDPGTSIAVATQPSAAPKHDPVPTQPEDSDAGVEEPDAPELYVEYRAANTNPDDGVIAPWLRIGNRGTGPGVPLQQLKLRYFVTNETNPLCVRECITELFWAGVLPGGTRVWATVEYVPSGWLTGYLEVSFPADAPPLRPREYVELQLQFHTGDYLPLSEANDYSFDATQRDFGESRRIAVYRSAKLVWGEAPPW